MVSGAVAICRRCADDLLLSKGPELPNRIKIIIRKGLFGPVMRLATLC